LVILLALVTIIAVGCSVVSNPATPNAALPNPPASGPPAPSPLSITSSSLPVATVGSGYSTMLQAIGGITLYSWSASGLPAGLALSTNTGQISGTPSTAGSYTVSASVRDSESSPAAASKTLSLNVASAAVLPLSITTTSLAAGTAGSSYSTALQAS